MVFFSGNSQCLKAVGHFCGGAPSWVFGRILDATLPNNSLQLAEALRIIFHHWDYTGQSWIHPASKLFWLTPKQQDKILDWPHVFISLGNSRNENANETFCPAPPPTLIHGRSKHSQITKYNNNAPCFPPHWFLTLSSQHKNCKANQYSITVVTKFGIPMSESSTKITNFMPPLFSHTNFVKTGIEK